MVVVAVLLVVDAAVSIVIVQQSPIKPKSAQELDCCDARDNGLPIDWFA